MIEQSAVEKAGVKLSYGMVGGGQGALVGDLHRKAIALDGLAELAAGCFSRSLENTAATGKALGVAPDRCYKTFEEMAEAEAKRPDKIDFVVVITPNDTHFEICKAFINKGIHVVCDKPLTLEAAEAQELADLAKKNKLLFAVTYTYTGYPAVKQVREMIRKGDIGEIRFVNAEYLQDWLATAVEKEGNKQAIWRLDPKNSGKTNCVGDIGSHIENMVSCMTGLRIKSLCARLDKIVEGRLLDDNANIMVEYSSGAKGLYWSSQVAVGYNNGPRVRILGTKGSIQWAQENPNHIDLFKLGQPRECWSEGREGITESMANIYKAYTGALSKLKSGQTPDESDLDFPGVEMGLDGVKFINKCAESSEKGAVWVNL
jgi:predicted dehydrogenase